MRAPGIYILLLVLLTAVASPAVAGPPAEPFFSIHVASFKSLENANRHVNNLRVHQKSVFWQEAVVPQKGLFYRVYVGRYATYEAALAVWKALKVEGAVSYRGIHRFTEPVVDSPPAERFPTPDSLIGTDLQPELDMRLADLSPLFPEQPPRLEPFASSRRTRPEEIREVAPASPVDDVPKMGTAASPGLPPADLPASAKDESPALPPIDLSIPTRDEEADATSQTAAPAPARAEAVGTLRNDRQVPDEFEVAVAVRTDSPVTEKTEKPLPSEIRDAAPLPFEDHGRPVQTDATETGAAPPPIASAGPPAARATGAPQPAATVALPATGRFVDNGDGTVTDTRTGLMWVKNGWRIDFVSARNWDAAAEGCRAFRHGGYADWRLPDLDEWRTIIDDRHEFPALVEPNPFENMIVHQPYWTASAVARSPVLAYTVLLYHGSVHRQMKRDLAFVMPVRTMR